MMKNNSKKISYGKTDKNQSAFNSKKIFLL